MAGVQAQMKAKQGEFNHGESCAKQNFATLLDQVEYPSRSEDCNLVESCMPNLRNPNMYNENLCPNVIPLALLTISYLTFGFGLG